VATDTHYVVDLSCMFENKEPIAYSKVDFHIKFYKGILEGKPMIEQLELLID
jgi:hypothetical protein